MVDHLHSQVILEAAVEDRSAKMGSVVETMDMSALGESVAASMVGGELFYDLHCDKI
jgi:hypothetical protein